MKINVSKFEDEVSDLYELHIECDGLKRSCVFNKQRLLEVLNELKEKIS